VQAHPALLGQAVDNLLDNACKYSSAGSPIVLRIWRQGEGICLAVEDQGDGIAAEELPHVFDPFFRSPQVRQRGIGGIGLGLAVTSRIVAAFGGRVEAHSQPRQGSRFVITLPGGGQRELSRRIEFEV
jgi:signal transduction histidine kinase